MKLLLSAVLLFAAVQVQASGLEIRMAEQAHLIPAPTKSCLSKSRGGNKLDIRASFISVPIAFVNNTEQFVAIDKIEVVVNAGGGKMGQVTLAGEELAAMGLEAMAPGSFLEATCPLIVGNIRRRFSNSYFAEVTVFGHSEMRNGELSGIESAKRINLIP